jgi:2-aminoadipate transaminase
MVNGSQQGLDLIGKLFVDVNSRVLTSRPTYLGALQAWNAYEAYYCTVPMDEDGMCVEEIPDQIKGGYRPKLVYVLPNFHNPAGTTLSLERREKLVEIARKYDLIIVEDDPYGELRFEGEDITPVFRMAPERTIYLSTFSKTLAPGLRLAWVVAPKPLITRLVQAKQGADLHTGTFVQIVTHEICQSGFLRGHVRTLRQVYHQRRDAMVDAMTEHFPPEIGWTVPQGGLFLWVRTSDRINTRDFLPKAVEEKVAYVPGFAFYPWEEGGEHTMRMNFSYSNEATINEGIARLGRAMKKELGSP